MRWLIDGYNVIRRDGDLRGAEARGLTAARAALLRLVVLAAERSGDPFTVVFDGAPGPEAAPQRGRVDVVFSRAPQTADDVLGALARRLREGAIVVSSDRTVQDAARRAGSVAMTAEIFLDAVAAGPADPDPTGATMDEEDDGDDRGRAGGNPRRRSRDERAVMRARARLLGRPWS